MSVHKGYWPFLFFPIILVTLMMNCDKNEGHSSTNTGSTFQLLTSEETGVDFYNLVHDEEAFNILTYRNFYNGGGIGIGDINNDSLPDLYFTANQQKNKLYLNKGNFTFEDITEKAGVAGSKKWSTGVTLADVNGDGWLDIYVSNSGDVNGKDRENELFINNGNLTFTESASQYNLNNSGYGTHAAFFDYDLDGDLDCYILNNSFKDPGKIELYKKVREIPDEGGDKLMRNEGSTFTDVTVQSGIYSSSIGFGLGVSVSDLNGDYLPDIFISNDFWERDYLYLNQGNGTFSEDLIERVDYCSVSSMGADIADLNNDGSPEIFTTDMLPGDNFRLKTTMVFDPYHLEDAKYRANFHYQIVQNCLHWNDGSGRFQEIASMAGVSATDWSWGALIFDFENDGFKDIFVSNGIQRDIMSMDFRDFIADTQKRNEIITSKGRFDLLDFIANIPSQPLKNYAFQNSGSYFFKDRADSLGLGQPSFSNGSAYGDLDNDGDYDLIVNNINSQAFIYKNQSNQKNNNSFIKVKFEGQAKNPFGIGSIVSVKAGEQQYYVQNYNTRGFESSIEPQIILGLGKTSQIDELKIIWPDLKEQVLRNIRPNQTITLKYGNASVPNKEPIRTINPLYTEASLPSNVRHTENRYNDFNDEILLMGMLSTQGPRLAVGDVNGDKRDDFILPGATGDYDKLFIQNLDGSFRYKSTALTQHPEYESISPVLFDSDNDGDLDLLVASGGNELRETNLHFNVRFYQNDGTGNFINATNQLPKIIGNFSIAIANDFDSDGDVDIFLGARSVPGNYGLPPHSYLLKNDPRGWYEVTSENLANAGMVTDAAWADVDGDHDNDLIVVGDWMPIKIFINEDGRLDKAFIIPESEGWWNRVHPDDLDQDGDIDFVLGNWGLNTKFKASSQFPLTMYVNDFDNNGKSEFIINWMAPLDKTSFPFAQKGEITTQLPGLRRVILKYQDYGYKNMDSLFSKEKINQSISYKTNNLKSSILWNQPGAFVLTPLPDEAQVSPIFGIATGNFDEDASREIWLGGNFYELKPQIGRHNANRGVMLKVRQSMNVINVPIKKWGLSVNGAVRDIKIIQPNNQILITINNERARLYKKTF